MSATRLTETQWMVLSAASQRDDHCAMLPPRLRGGAAQKVVKKLIDLGLVEAVRARGDLPVWRREDDRCPAPHKPRLGTNSGRARRVGAEPARQRSGARGWCEDGRESPRWLQASPVISMLQRPEGATLQAIMAVTGWQRDLDGRVSPRGQSDRIARPSS
jgi:hypothetical protein